jgi:paraquat-inducible protein A
MALLKYNTYTLTGLLILATGLLIAGLVMPMMTITKLVFFSNSFSVLMGVNELLENGHYLLFILVTGFSIVLPVVKIGLLFWLLNFRHPDSEKMNKVLHLMHEYGRWAMLDVLVVAVLLVTVKLGAIASIEVHSGLYVFGVAVLLIMFITNRVVKLIETPVNE